MLSTMLSLSISLPIYYLYNRLPFIIPIHYTHFNSKLFQQKSFYFWYSAVSQEI